MSSYDFGEKEVVCLNVARARELGKYNLMMGQNPIYIFTMQNIHPEIKAPQEKGPRMEE